VQEVVYLFQSLETLAREAEPIARMTYNSGMYIRKMSRTLRMFIFKASLMELRDAAYAVDTTLGEEGFQRIHSVLTCKYNAASKAASRDQEGFLTVLRTLRIHI
jgi:hypothetical protein